MVKVPPAKLARVVEAARYLLRLHQKTLPAPASMSEMILAGWVAQAITAAADLGVADALAGQSGAGSGPSRKPTGAATIQPARRRRATAVISR